MTHTPFPRDASANIPADGSKTSPWTRDAEQLQEALNSRAVIEQAKGVLMGQQGLSPHEAYEQLRSQARSQRRRLTAVSADVVRNAVSPA